MPAGHHHDSAAHEVAGAAPGRPSVEGTGTMPDLQEVLTEVATRHGVPGMSAAVLRDGRTHTAVHGVTHIGRSTPVSRRTAFRVLSVSKTLNATLVMTVLADRLGDLDRPVTTWVDTSCFSRPELAQHVTLRHLLSHTSGLDSELFVDGGDADDAIRRWLTHLPQLSFVAAPGEVFSYSNAGVVLSAHIAEQIEGRPWTALVRERVLEPMGIAASWTDGEQPGPADVAGEHAMGDPWQAASDGRGGSAAVALDPSRDPLRMRSTAPTGGWVVTPEQLVRFGSHHLDSPAALVPAQVRAAMRVPHVTKPLGYHGFDQQCLGFVQYAFDGPQMLGHNGQGVGQTAGLRLLPDAGIVVAVAANVDDLGPVRDVLQAILESVPGLRQKPTAPPAGLASQDERRRVLGTYERRHYRFTISEDPADPTGPLRMASDTDPAFVPAYTNGPVGLVPYADGSVDLEDGEPGAFLGDDGQGRARWFQLFGRVHVRV